ncbi:MAG: membrane integrity-associated transporter subunit PqiC [Deltaproteobacteria bacterium]|nr:membrane integrity-associated transporter subunit PqiC [Deltaproteobacteria bacterium]MBW2046969.1 membrane integrity-associated transporter subunit PqiC [Deltaproteobacteria bacterium]MBW2109872.1 membrane integrity-associated transporter subunit PqiC [Deltaproteobacteria bacterium]MBW2352513.1 membrane integrity-associated transporter subunit PqiC [Deltaproteobacteria bacterium]HDZ91760.1 membrane integrity-associated transporter subunit PqiC [Deltaproteobacteria bacterium]
MTRIPSLIKTFASAVLLITLVACASTGSSNFYLLNPITDMGKASETKSGQDPVSVGIGPLELPAYLDREQIVTRLNPNELRVSEFDEWAEPLNAGFTRVLMENLSMLLARDRFIIFPFRGPEGIDYQVEIEVFRFDGRLGGEVSLMTRWSIFRVDTGEMVQARKSSFQASSGGPGYRALVAAQSRTVEALSREIAGAIKGLPEKR